MRHGRAFLAGWCLYQQDDFKGAVAALDQAIAADPADETNYLDVASSPDRWRFN